MDILEYIMIHISMIPQEFIIAYNFKDKVHNGYIFAWVTNGIYGILQVGRLSHNPPVQHLEPYEYHSSDKTPGLWTHENFLINFILIVDDFGVKYSVK